MILGLAQVPAAWHTVAMKKRQTEPKTCPECGHVFQGDGWDGIDQHWRFKHKHMSYEQAWPLIQSGTYVPLHTKRKPRGDTNQIAYRVMQEVIKRSES